jgi:transcriptional regulator with XRE-family HTH domain
MVQPGMSYDAGLTRGEEAAMTRSDETKPALARLRLRRQERRARENAKWTQQAISDEMDWSISKIIRLENGTSPFSTSDLRALLTHYRLPDTEIAKFVELARAGRAPGVAARYRDVLHRHMAEWIEFEAAADVICWYEADLVPGIAQTMAYATAAMAAFARQKPDETEADLAARCEALVQARLDRAEPLLQVGGPAIQFIVHESALRLVVDPAGAMADQLRHLKHINTVGRAASGSIEAGLNPNVSVQVVPFSAGFRGIRLEPFELLQFGDEADDPLVFLESRRGDTIIRDEVRDTKTYVDAFRELRDSLPPPGRTNEMLDLIIDSMPA